MTLKAQKRPSVVDSGAELVAEQIRSAFRGVPYPGDEHLSAWSREEALDQAGPLVGKRWRDLKFEDVAQSPEALVWLFPEAFRYYLPAYLTMSVRYWRVAPKVLSCVVFMLSSGPKTWEGWSQKGRHYQRTGAGFSPEQQAAIERGLEYLLESEIDSVRKAQIRHALDSHWSKTARGHRGRSG